MPVTISCRSSSADVGQPSSIAIPSIIAGCAAPPRASAAIAARRRSVASDVAPAAITPPSRRSTPKATCVSAAIMRLAEASASTNGRPCARACSEIETT